MKKKKSLRSPHDPTFQPFFTRSPSWTTARSVSCFVVQPTRDSTVWKPPRGGCLLSASGLAVAGAWRAPEPSSSSPLPWTLHETFMPLTRLREELWGPSGACDPTSLGEGFAGEQPLWPDNSQRLLPGHPEPLRGRGDPTPPPAPWLLRAPRGQSQVPSPTR